MTSLMSSVEITPLNQDQVKVAIVVDADLVHSLLQTLDALTGLTTILRSKIRLARNSRTNDVLQREALNQRDQFYARVVALYDDLLSQGMKRTAAIKAISRDLRKENHPWGSVDLVRTALNDAGRPRRRIS